ncbi:helix-turn-helix domain-containing protein [Ornithinibacillus xuwenensis]|uniref:Helix-turn-helix domain-containing protein n=1 Tax=Ornithinibacillus xuwenensis TaxID=3144668 RepID=A0ABU9XBU2_9BACI
MNFSKRLRELREDRGLSQEELAKLLDIPRSSLTHYEDEDDERLPRKNRLYEIADFFNVTVDYLLGRTEEKNLTETEQLFVEDSNTLTVDELQEKYKLLVDGKPATKEEIEGVKAFIRSLRGMK